jgi:hypothetical protein
MNNVSPMPRRGAFTGVAGSDGVDDGFEVSGFPGVLSGGLPGLFGPGLVLVRLRLGLVVPVLVGLTLGREVRKAPRTSSSCTTGAAIPITTAQRQTRPKTMKLNRITESPYMRLNSEPNCAEYGCRKQWDFRFDRMALSL